MTDALRGLIKEKIAAFRKFKKLPNDESRSNFCAVRNKVTRLLQKAERQYVQSLHRSRKLSGTPTSVRQFWLFIKGQSGKGKSTVIPDLVSSEFQDSSRQLKFACSDVDKANVLNKFFCQPTLLTGSDREVPPIDHAQRIDDAFSDLHTTPSAV